ncbi:MAG: hypothetical protein M0005_05435 [Actinomycetota bacterium]|nr:hypothetical protein [Actinomycetota bacterium]
MGRSDCPLGRSLYGAGGETALEELLQTFEPYPWGRFDWARTLLLDITVAQALVPEYARAFQGLSDGDLVALAEPFAFDNCEVREPLRGQLVKALGEP